MFFIKLVSENNSMARISYTNLLVKKVDSHHHACENSPLLVISFIS